MNNPVSNDIDKNLYVDNLITGLQTVEEAISYYKQCKVIFNNASMNMCKWVSNSNEVMYHIKQEDKSNEKTTKALGMMWNIEKDELTLLKHTNRIMPDVMTKRYIY